MSNEPKLPSVALVIFGAAGDLTWRKLVPALYNLSLDHLLPEKFAVIGVDGKPIDLADWHLRLHSGVDQFSRRGKVSPADWDAFAIKSIELPFWRFQQCCHVRVSGGCFKRAG